MSAIIIRGGRPLSGSLTVQGLNALREAELIIPYGTPRENW